MFGILLTILVVGAFFILFFKSPYNLKKKKKKEEEEVSSTVGYVEDTGLESYGDVMKPGDIGTFVAFSTIPDDNWLSGSPHVESDTDNVPARLVEREEVLEELRESLSVS